MDWKSHQRKPQSWTRFTMLAANGCRRMGHSEERSQTLGPRDPSLRRGGSRLQTPRRAAEPHEAFWKKRRPRSMVAVGFAAKACKDAEERTTVWAKHMGTRNARGCCRRCTQARKFRLLGTCTPKHQALKLKNFVFFYDFFAHSVSLTMLLPGFVCHFVQRNFLCS